MRRGRVWRFPGDDTWYGNLRPEEIERLQERLPGTWEAAWVTERGKLRGLFPGQERVEFDLEELLGGDPDVG